MIFLRVIVLLIAGPALSACGADGEPVQPSVNANVGVTTDGSYVYGGLGLHRGPVSIFLGF